MFTIRFDLRAPATGAPTAELYAAALDMGTWADSRGALSAVVCEHHTMDDGYLPSPMLFAAALAARTTVLPITIAAVILPLYNPVRLAEEMVVLDIISGGRVSYVCAVGYRAAEYEHHGVDFHRRGRIADDALGVLLRAKTGEPFEHDDRRIHVTPAPVTPGGPSVAWGGGSVAAAKRAGRHGIDFFGQRGDRSLKAVYQDTARSHGHEPGWCFLPPADLTTTLFVADDVDRAWDEIGSYLLHDAVSYAAINAGDTGSASMSGAATVDDLRAEGGSHRIVTVDEAVAIARSGEFLQLHPLVGGLPPAIAWPYLRRVTEEVMPALVG